MASQAQKKTKVFIGYSHQDSDWLARLLVHLKPLERHHGIEIWDDTKIKPGSKWKDEINEAIRSAKAIVLLISADFLASDFIANNELPTALHAAGHQGSYILPVVLSPSFLKGSNLAEFQAVNDPSKPLVSMTKYEQESVFVKLTETIESLVGYSQDQDSSLSSSALDKSTTSPYQLQDIGGYIIIGLEDESLFSIFKLFGDVPTPDQTDERNSVYEEVFFDDFNEMKDVFDALNKSIARGKELEKRGIDRQQAFERALKEESISRASRFATKRRQKDAQQSDISAPGFRYIIFGVRRGYSDMIRLLRPQQFANKHGAITRDAHEVYFEDITLVPQIPIAIQKAVKEAQGDDEEFKTLLFEAAMRLRTFGGDSERS